jgi:alcohol dehydrogenase class IV
LLDGVRNALNEKCVGVFPGVRVHGPITAVLTAADELKRLKADAVIAVGGGSVTVTARAASIVLAEGADIAALSTSIDARGQLSSPKLLATKIPQFVVPTTTTTATVKAGSAVFDTEARKRRALFDTKTRAQAIFVDPDLLRSAPSQVVIGAGLNTLVMSIEGIVSRRGDPISDALLMHAVRLSAKCFQDREAIDDETVRTELVLPAIMCGRGTDHTGAGIALTFGHVIGSRHDIDNGIANAIVLPAVIRFNGDTARAAYEKVAAAMGLAYATGDRLISALTEKCDRLFDTLGVPRRLRDVGIQQSALPEIAALALEDWFLRGNPKAVTHVSELEGILREAW